MEWSGLYTVGCCVSRFVSTINTPEAPEVATTSNTLRLISFFLFPPWFLSLSLNMSEPTDTSGSTLTHKKTRIFERGIRNFLSKKRKKKKLKKTIPIDFDDLFRNGIEERNDNWLPSLADVECFTHYSEAAEILRTLSKQTRRDVDSPLPTVEPRSRISSCCCFFYVRLCGVTVTSSRLIRRESTGVNISERLFFVEKRKRKKGGNRGSSWRAEGANSFYLHFDFIRQPEEEESSATISIYQHLPAAGSYIVV